MKDFSKSYEYGDFYITSSYFGAIGFSFNSGGELGEWAYHQCIGIKDFNIEVDDKIKRAMEKVVEEYEKYKNSEKIILVFKNIRYKDLFYERGGSFYIDNYEKDKELEEDWRKEIKYLYNSMDRDNVQHNYNYRLKNLDKYVAYLLREKDFKKGFKVFTQVENVEKFIENENRISSRKIHL